MNIVTLLLGANLGDEKVIFQKVLSMLSSKVGICKNQSSLYISKPWGFEHANDFYNQVLVFETNCSSQEVLQKCLETETELGRVRIQNSGYMARIIDIDILYFNSDVIELENLQIPHPQLHKRKFTLEPLCEIIPNYIHPIFKKTQTQLLKECDDTGVVIKE